MINESPSTAVARRPLQWLNAARYLLKRLAAIAVTIVAGVFIAVVMANHQGSLDMTARVQVERVVYNASISDDFNGDLDALRAQLETERGVALSFWPRHILYTFKALTFNWGDAWDFRKFNTWIKKDGGLVNTLDSGEIILAKLPNTLLLSGTAFLLLALIGIPMALFLSQREGRRLDRVVGVLTTLSSVPSWVIGILLVVVFAVQFKLLPAGKMIDSIPPQTALETIQVVARHLVLPVAAIFISLIFQLVYSWRTYLLVYSDEDYLILARAKGLKKQALNFNYILRPALPFIVTNLVITLVGFWQASAALEYFYQWPGIGKLFVDALPNFRSESMYSGEMGIVIGLVVMFAYLLGISVFMVELSYFLLDPRIRVESQGQANLSAIRQPRGQRRAPAQAAFRPTRQSSRPDLRGWLRGAARDLGRAPRSAAAGLRRFFCQVYRVPSALAGFSLLALLLVVSALVLIYIPYDPVARDWASSSFSETPIATREGLPRWINWLRINDLPSTRVIDGQPGASAAQAAAGGSEMSSARLDFSFDFPYQEFPGGLALYISAEYAEKKPFVTPTWITPDGREIELKSITAARTTTYAFAENVPVSRLLRSNALYKRWVEPKGSQMTPEFYLLFADPLASTASALPGTYHLRLDSILFEPGSRVSARLVVFGQVEGWAGTDSLRRDLSIPLLWGLPFALLVGVVGAVTTSLIALMLAAAGAWLGGWVDTLIQRLTEINLILPVMGIGVLLYSYYNINMWVIIGLIMLSSALGSSIKAFRAAFIQEKSAAYIEAARAYGASDWRIITHYLVRRILPVSLPQMVMLIPSFIFLEATLAIFNINDVRYPTWGNILYSALRYGSMFGSKYWVLQPLALMLVTGLAFVLISFGLNRMLIPRLNETPVEGPTPVRAREAV